MGELENKWVIHRLEASILDQPNSKCDISENKTECNQTKSGSFS